MRLSSFVLARTLALRREHPQLFAAGSYEPIAVTGPRANHLLAFARRLDSAIAVVVVPRFPHALLGDGDRITVDPCVWQDTALTFEGASSIVWRNIFDDGINHGANEQIAATSILSRWPVALLMATP